MHTPILETKFHIPPWHSESVVRLRLLEKLEAGLNEQCKLTLVSAPAGYGKTTLVTGWLQSIAKKLHIAWLSIEQSDNDPARFMNYWINAIQRMDGIEEVDYLQSLLELPQLPPLNTILDILLNNLALIEGQAVLVLDDYHTLTNPIIHEALEYFLDHQPAQVHVVLTTREDPPLPLARLRARGQMVEIRAGDLRFTAEEAGQFFSQSMQLDLKEETVIALETRTEGWIVGLQLAALAFQNLSNPQAFVDTFRGSHRYILDYLAEEVIRQQEDDLRQFLIQTSVLERFNADLCQALTGYPDSQRMLARLEQANLFLIPLDNERVWYRYHHLFADYLRTELSRTEAAELYKKASAWHEENNQGFEAVQYALASTDPEFVGDVIDRTLKKDYIWSGGNLALYLSWLDALPPQVFHNRPQLSLNASRILYLAGRFNLADELITQTEQFLRSLTATPERDQMLALAVLYRGSIASVRGDVEKAIERTTFAQSQLSRENHLAHARGYFSLGLAYELSGQNEQAIKNYLLSSDEAYLAGVLFLAINARCAAAQVQITQGKLHLAQQNCEYAIKLSEGRRLAPLGLAWSILGGIALERNDHVAAEPLLQDGITLSRQGGLLDDVVIGLVSLARLCAYQGNTSSAFDAVQEINAIVQGYGVQRMTLLASAYLARLHIYTGQKQAAKQWAEAYQSVRDSQAREFEDLTLVRVLLMTGDIASVSSILNPLLERAQCEGRLKSCMEIMILFALYHHAEKDISTAVDWLSRAINLAAPEGFVQTFLDEGDGLLDLLPKVRQSAPEFVDVIMNSYQGETDVIFSPLDQLPDPLSEQELRVLKLIVMGKVNKEIAEELVISVGTAKWHVHNVFQKLGVSNRPQAIALAKKLDLM